MQYTDDVKLTVEGAVLQDTDHLSEKEKPKKKKEEEA